MALFPDMQHIPARGEDRAQTPRRLRGVYREELPVADRCDRDGGRSERKAAVVQPHENTEGNLIQLQYLPANYIKFF